MDKKNILPVALFSLGAAYLLLNSPVKAATDNQGKKFTPPFSSPTDFIKLYWPFAKQYSAGGSIPALVTIAQAGIESGWGTSHKFMYYNNVFGIKAGGNWAGETDGKGFRAYDSIEDSFKDHANLLSHDTRYSKAFDPLNVPDAFTFAQIIAPIYTPDAGYFDLIKATMQKIQPFVS